MNHIPHEITFSTTSSPHHERSNHIIDHGHSAPRALVPPQHNGRSRSAGQISKEKYDDHILWQTNGMRLSRRERVVSRSKMARISRAKRSVARACSARFAWLIALATAYFLP
jgi:hypothetical protein